MWMGGAAQHWLVSHLVVLGAPSVWHCYSIRQQALTFCYGLASLVIPPLDCHQMQTTFPNIMGPDMMMPLDQFHIIFIF
jgi:hypothetical protein